MDIDKFMKEERRKEAERREKFFRQCNEKENDGETMYKMYALLISHKFGLSTRCGIESIAYKLANYYVENVDEDIYHWLYKDDAPYIMESSRIKELFPEFKHLKSNVDIMNMANEVYGLNFEYVPDYSGMDGSYIISTSFSFNSFTPIDTKEIVSIKEEIETLKKYGHEEDVQKLEDKLKAMNLPLEIIDGL